MSDAHLRMSKVNLWISLVHYQFINVNFMLSIWECPFKNIHLRMSTFFEIFTLTKYLRIRLKNIYMVYLYEKWRRRNDRKTNYYRLYYIEYCCYIFKVSFIKWISEAIFYCWQNYNILLNNRMLVVCVQGSSTEGND